MTTPPLRHNPPRRCSTGGDGRSRYGMRSPELVAMDFLEGSLRDQNSQLHSRKEYYGVRGPNSYHTARMRERSNCNYLRGLVHIVLDSWITITGQEHSPDYPGFSLIPTQVISPDEGHKIYRPRKGCASNIQDPPGMVVPDVVTTRERMQFCSADR